MSRHGRGGSKGHRVSKVFPDCYRISWIVDRHYKNSQLRHPIGYSTITDLKGAIRFVKKWGLSGRKVECCEHLSQAAIKRED